MATHVKVRVCYVLFMQVSYPRHALPTILWHVSLTIFIAANSTKHLSPVLLVSQKKKKKVQCYLEIPMVLGPEVLTELLASLISWRQRYGALEMVPRQSLHKYFG